MHSASFLAFFLCAIFSLLQLTLAEPIPADIFEKRALAGPDSVDASPTTNVTSSGVLASGNGDGCASGWYRCGNDVNACAPDGADCCGSGKYCARGKYCYTGWWDGKIKCCTLGQHCTFKQAGKND